MAEQKIGVVTHYFSHIQVGAIQLTDGPLAVGDTIRIKGHTSDFTQVVDSMQIDKQTVPAATVGQSVGLRMKEHARVHDQVFKVIPD